MTLDGWVADAAKTYAVGGAGAVSPVAEKLLKVTEESLFKGAEQARVGNRLGAVSNAIQKHVEGEGLSIVRSLVGGTGCIEAMMPCLPQRGRSAGSTIWACSTRHRRSPG